MAPARSKRSRAKSGVERTAQRQRSSWFLKVTRVVDDYQVTIGYKNTRGLVTSFSKSNSYPKIPFGPIAKTDFYPKRKNEAGGGEVGGKFRFENKSRASTVLKEAFMNNLNIGGTVDEFAQRVTSMIIAKRQKLLAQYLSVLSQSKGFVHHREEFHEETGFLSDGTEIQEIDFIRAGGSLPEFLQFTEVAKSSAVVVEKELLLTKDKITNYFNKGQKRSESGSHKPIKKTRGEHMDDNENKEIEDGEGLEQEYTRSYLGIANILLDNISVAPDLKDLINPYRVHSIADSMKKYDPSIAVLVVCPEDITEPVDLNNTSNRKFHCIQKIHTVEAFKSLDKDGKFESLVGHDKRTVVAYVIRTDNKEVVHYGHLRADAIESHFSKKLHPQQLLHIFGSLTDKDSVNSFKAIVRMCKLCRVGPNEATAIRKLCKWSKEAFKELIKVIEFFEHYETLDVKASGHQSRLIRGEKMPVPNKLFNQLSKVDENYFVDRCGKILEKKTSLKSLVDGYEMFAGMKKVTAVLSVLAEHKAYEQLQHEFPGRFELDQLKPFIGAEVKEGKMNESASRLKKYYNAVVSHSPTPDIEMLEFKELDDLEELKDSGVFDKFDTILLVLGKEKKESAEVCLAIADLVINSTESYKSAIIVFPSEDQHFQFMSHIRTQDTSLIDAETLLISCQIKKHKSIQENVSFGAMIGKNISFKFPINKYQSNISNLKEVIESISPQGASTLVVSDMIPLMKIHSELVGKVAYYGPKDEIFNFRHLLTKDESFQKVTDDGVGEATDEDDDEAHEATMALEEKVVASDKESAAKSDKVKVKHQSLTSYQSSMDEISDSIDLDLDIEKNGVSD